MKSAKGKQACRQTDEELVATGGLGVPVLRGFPKSAKGTKPSRQTDEELVATGGLGVPVLRGFPMRGFPKRYVALFRGINVGGKNMIPMKDLVLLFSEAKCRDVASYIQSGNVVFSADGKTAAKVGSMISRQIEQNLGFRTQMILRTESDMQRIAASNPYADVEKSHVAFLSAQPNADLIASLDPNRSTPDEFIVRGSEIYLHLPNGTARSKLTNAYFDSKLKTVSTIRNWRTVQTLLAMLAR